MIDFIEFNLDNGLHCILHKDITNPIVNITVGYRVGSRDEIPGKKGVAHLFEHLMFQGSANVKKGEHFEFVQRAGGNCNAFTNQDMTVYYENLPSNHLETGLWLESDRMNSIDLSEENIQNQKSVVIQEKMQNYDNAPYGTTFVNILKNVFKGSSYEISTIGNEDDINSFKKSEAEEFHFKYYSPANASLLISGDINYSETEKLIKKYFGNIKKGGAVNREFAYPEIMISDIRQIVSDNISLPVLYICYPIPEAGSNEEYTLEYFTNIVANNRSSRLFKNLVYEKKLLKEIHASKFQLQHSGVFVFSVVAYPDGDMNKIEKEILSEVNYFTQNGITDKEYAKIKNKLDYGFNIRFLTLQNIGRDLFENWFYFNDAGRINSELGKYLNVKKEDVINSVKKYLTDTPKLFLTYIPKAN